MFIYILFCKQFVKTLLHTFKFFISIAKSNIFFVPKTLMSMASPIFSLNFTEATTLKTICKINIDTEKKYNIQINKNTETYCRRNKKK